MDDVLRAISNTALSHGINTRELQERFLLSLTQEIAMGINDLPDILTAHGLSVAQYTEILKQPRFLELLRAQQLAWSKAETAETRIRLKMQAMVEQALPELFKELLKDGLTAAKVELVKTFLKGGGLAEQANTAAPGEGVKITINMGPEQHVIAPAASAPTITIDHDIEDAEEAA